MAHIFRTKGVPTSSQTPVSPPHPVLGRGASTQQQQQAMKVAAAVGLLAAVGAAQQHEASTCAAAGGERKVRFWVGLNGAGGVGIVDRTTNASC